MSNIATIFVFIDAPATFSLGVDNSEDSVKGLKSVYEVTDNKKVSKMRV